MLRTQQLKINRWPHLRIKDENAPTSTPQPSMSFLSRRGSLCRDLRLVTALKYSCSLHSIWLTELSTTNNNYQGKYKDKWCYWCRRMTRGWRQRAKPIRSAFCPANRSFWALCLRQANTSEQNAIKFWRKKNYRNQPGQCRMELYSVLHRYFTAPALWFEPIIQSV